MNKKEKSRWVRVAERMKRPNHFHNLGKFMESYGTFLDNLQTFIEQNNGVKFPDLMFSNLENYEYIEWAVDAILETGFDGKTGGKRKELVRQISMLAWAIGHEQALDGMATEEEAYSEHEDKESKEYGKSLANVLRDASCKIRKLRADFWGK